MSSALFSIASLSKLSRAAGFSRAACSARLFSSAAESAATSSATTEESAPPPPPPTKLFVFGGRGFVGSHVCKEAVSSGLEVVSISRSGTPPAVREPWMDQVQWLRGNALEPRTFEKHLTEAAAVISCIGGFGNNEQMMKVNGTANVDLVKAAKAAGVPRFVFISATIPNVPGIEMLLGGYVKGKAAVEAALAEHYPESGYYLKPSVIYGNRVVSHSLSLPLQYLFKPLEAALKYAPDEGRKFTGIPFVGALFLPPVNVEAVARAAVRAATDPSIPPGEMDVYTVQSYSQ
eukprot:gene5825-6110_t